MTPDTRIDILKAALASRRSKLLSAAAATHEPLRETRPADEAWSVAMVLEHLAQTEAAVTRLFGSLLEKAEPREAADLFDPEEFSKHLDMPVFLDRTRRLKLSQPSGSVPAALGRENR